MQTGVSFPISKVERAAPGKYKPIDASEAIKGLSGITVEASGGNLTGLIGPYVDRWNGTIKMNGFLRAIHAAFADHHPLVLSPDDVWLALAQGFANHVNANAEQLRSKFVKHEGKEYIEVRRDAFIKGSPDNDWPGAFAEFSDRIAEHIGDAKRRMLVSDFSTTGPTEKAASEVVLMESVKAYFDYGMRTMCGIPKMTLLGTQDDWRSIKDRVQMFAEFEAADWVKATSHVLDHFIEAFKGNADPQFWESFYKEGGGSGGPYVTGAVNVFFPYLPSYKTGKNEAVNRHAMSTDWGKRLGHMGGGPNVGDFPMGLSTVPFVWHYYAEKFDMNFLGGFVGTSEDPQTGALRPAIGWGIADRAKAD